MDLLSKLWDKVSRIGIRDAGEERAETKRSVLTNRINFILVCLAMVVFVALAIFSPVKFQEFNANEYRIVLVALLGIVNLALASFGARKLSKISLIFMPAFILAIFPVLFGVVNDEIFLDVPLLIITASLTPHFILSYKKEKVVYSISLVYFFLLLLPLEKILNLYINPEIHILNIISENFLYMKLAQISVYLFLNLCVMYLLLSNQQYESNLEYANIQLQNQSVIITRQSDELSLQNMQLREQKEELRNANDELNVQNEELMATIDELKETQEQLVQAEKMASIGILTAGIAHEINNPINYINSGLEGLRVSFGELSKLLKEMIELPESGREETLSYLHQLQIKYNTEELFESIPILVGNIQQGSSRASEIVSSLLYLTRSSADKSTSSDVHENLEAALVMLNHQMSNKIQVEKQYGSLPMINCFPGKIYQVFMNLLINAVQAIEGDGMIYIQTEVVRNKEKIRIKIRDTGVGIPEEYKSKIFDPFFSTKEVGKGTGLGLSIVMKIVKEHNGDIFFHSESGKGTEFIVELPINPFK